MQKTGQFRAKPDPGQNLSGKKFVPKNFLSCIDFKNEVFKNPDFGLKSPICHGSLSIDLQKIDRKKYPGICIL